MCVTVPSSVCEKCYVKPIKTLLTNNFIFS